MIKKMLFGSRDAGEIGSFTLDAQRIQLLKGLAKPSLLQRAGSDLYDTTILAHELAGHFWQHVASPYGLHMWRSYWSRVALVKSLIFRLRSECGYESQIFVPIRQWYAKAASPEVRKCIRAFLDKWNALEDHQRHMEGGLDVARLGMRDVIDPWSQTLSTLFILGGGDQTVLRERGIGSMRTAEARALPVFRRTDGTEYGLGAAALSEGFALAQEMDFLGPIEGSESTMQRRLRESPPVPYKIAWDYVQAVAGSECQLATWVATLADLALCGPVDIHHVVGEEGPILWEEVHPGWRFARAVGTAKALGMLTGPNRIGPGRRFDYLETIEEICEELGWMRPWELSEKSQTLSAGDPARDWGEIPIFTVPEWEDLRIASPTSDNRSFVVYYYKTGTEIRRLFPDAIPLPLANPFFTALLTKHLPPFHMWVVEGGEELVLEEPPPLELLAALGGRPDWEAKLRTMPGTPPLQGGAQTSESVSFSAAVEAAYHLVDGTEIASDHDAVIDRIFPDLLGISADELSPVP